MKIVDRYTVHGWHETVEWGCVSVTLENVKAESPEEAASVASDYFGITVESVEPREED